MPTGNLPESGKKLWEEVYDKALKGSCKGDKECAAGSAWKAVKNAGWKKDAQGQWHKSANLEEFSLRIEKAIYDKATHEMRWKAVASDTDEDKGGDNMTLELFSDFIGRIQTNELVPEHFRSDFWSGGMPYVSISHYPDYNGKGVPGTTDAVYVDGTKFKSKGKFFDNSLGKACFNALCDDLYGENKDGDNKVRISIAFLDYAHEHKSNGYNFIRESIEDICPECLKELITGKGEGKIFKKGHLIHLALTRVPMNERTNMEVEKSMTTRKEDAASIIGDELAEELEEQAELVVGKSEALVIKAEEELTPEPVVEEMEHEDEEDDEEEEKPKKKVPMKAEVVEPKAELSEIVKAVVAELGKKEVPADQHPLDIAFSEFKSAFDEVQKSTLAGDDRLRAIQEPFNTVAVKVRDLLTVSAPVAEVKAEVQEISELRKDVSNLTQQIGLLVSQLSRNSTKSVMMDVPQRRSLTAPPFIPQLQEAQQNADVAKSEIPNLRAIINRTTY